MSKETEEVLTCMATGKEYRGKYKLRNFRISAARKGYGKDDYTLEDRPTQTPERSHV